MNKDEYVDGKFSFGFEGFDGGGAFVESGLLVLLLHDNGVLFGLNNDLFDGHFCYELSLSLVLAFTIDEILLLLHF